MNIFTKTIISTSILASYTVDAQTSEIKFVNIPTTINHNYDFNGYWGIYNDAKNSNYRVTGTKLINNSTKTSENLSLDLFLVPPSESLDLTNLPNKITTNATIGKLEPNGTSFNNVVVSIKNADLEQYNLKELVPVLLLMDKDKNTILNYKVLNNNFNTAIVTNTGTINTTIPSKVDVFDPIPSATPEFSKFNPYVTAESTLELFDINKKLKLSGDWSFEIDYEKMTVSINGDKNTIENYGFKPSNKLMLMLYFSKQDINANKIIDGYDFVSFELDPIDGSTKLDGPIFHDNITKLVLDGEYYPILVLKELNTDKGEYNIKSAIKLGDKVKF